LSLKKLTKYFFFSTVGRQTSECTLWSNINSKPVFLVSGDEKFIVPPECAFIVGDVRLSRHLLFRGMKFDLIVLDPPWNNKSVKRCAVYDIFNEAVLFELRLRELLSSNGIVVLWLTNNSRVHSIAEQFLAHHSLRKLAVWYWLKVTRSGEVVCKFQPEHKVPFESIIIACDQNAVHSEYNFRDGYVVISTPSAVHSRKPPIAKLLSSLNIFSSKKTLELFGRYLLPFTTTIGFESVKLQNTRFFECTG
uniref:MT-A70 family protein n=1 Tax=Syphacia muris TaxID=451379 RepID=A0A0N5AQ06_9BILA